MAQNPNPMDLRALERSGRRHKKRREGTKGDTARVFSLHEAEAEAHESHESKNSIQFKNIR